MTSETSRAAGIAALNDACRKSRGTIGRHYMTDGVAALGQDFIVKAIAAVAAFDTFSKDNDPYGEHDFGKVVAMRSSASTCMRVSLSSTVPLQSPFLFLRRAAQGVDFGSFGRGHALQRIDLYPVRAQAPSSHNQYSRMPKARKRR